MSTFDIALSGLSAARAELDVTGNNVANSNTTGYKRSRAEFADLFAQTNGGLNKTAIGNGVRLAAVTQQFDQGNIENTNSNLDLALNGNGFFVLSDDGSRVFSRDGGFQVNRDGYVVNNRGQRLQAYPALDPQGTNFNTGNPSDLQIQTGLGTPQATGQVDARVNFSASDTVLGGAGSDIDPSDASSYNFTTALTVYDSLGSPHTATVYARRTADLTYSTRVDVEGTNMGTQDLTFDSSGALTTGQPVSYAGTYTPTNGAAPIDLDYDFSGSTLLGDEFSVNDLTQDGFTTGRLAGIEVSEEGVFAARYTNGRSVALGKTALANFDNPQGLSQLGDNAWAESFDSGAAQLGEAGTSDLGSIQSGALESSNVDLTQQLVNLITAQRNFQANSKVISTADQVTQTAINITR
jgi:flagellar hook protein FlgE